jgi:hypothetical protein
MIGRLRQRIARWAPMFEHLLAGNLWFTARISVLLLLGWYFLTVYWWQPIMGVHEELEYGFLLCPVAALGLRAARIRRGIDDERTRPSLPLSAQTFPPVMLAAMCERVEVKDPAVQDFFRWTARMLRKAKHGQLLSIQEIPRAWRRRPSYWPVLVARTGVPLALAIFLASSWQYYLGDFLARGLDRLPFIPGPITGGEVCPQDPHSSCTQMETQTLPGDLFALRGNAPDAGRLRFRVRNWPRSGRVVHFRSEGLIGIDPENFGIDFTFPVRGRIAEVPYTINDPNVWSVWATIEYFPFQGEKFQTAAYSGVRVPSAVSPDRYRGGQDTGGTER